MTIIHLSREQIRAAAQRARKGEKTDSSFLPVKVRVAIERGFTSKEINALYKKSQLRREQSFA